MVYLVKEREREKKKKSMANLYLNDSVIVLQVREKSSVSKVVMDKIAEFIQESYPNNESGIIYCFSRKECEQVCIYTLSALSRLLPWLW